MAKTITIRGGKAIAERLGYLLASPPVGADKEGVPRIYDRTQSACTQPIGEQDHSQTSRNG